MPSEALRRKLKEEYRKRFPKQEESQVICLEDKTLYEESMPDAVYVINLDESPNRWEKVKAQLDCAGINNAQRFSATNGYNIKITDLTTNQEFSGIDIKNKTHQLEKGLPYKIICNPEANLPTEFIFLGNDLNGRKISAGEIGLYCSYERIYENAKANGYKNILILEDDIHPKNLFKEKLSLVMRNVPDSYDLLYLSINLILGSQISYNQYINSFSNDATGWGTWGVILSAKGINKLLSLDNYTYPLDHFFWCLSTGISGIESHEKEECNSYPRLETYVSSETLVGLVNEGSQIDEMGRFA